MAMSCIPIRPWDMSIELEAVEDGMDIEVLVAIDIDVLLMSILTISMAKVQSSVLLACMFRLLRVQSRKR